LHNILLPGPPPTNMLVLDVATGFEPGEKLMQSFLYWSHLVT
jgi:hypothetical protein